MTRAEAEPLWEKARLQANAMLSELEKAGQIDFNNPDIPENAMARICLIELLVIALSPVGDQQIKNSALRSLLSHTKPKPVVRSEIRLQKDAETAAWLEAAIEDHRATSSETAAVPATSDNEC